MMSARQTALEEKVLEIVCDLSGMGTEDLSPKESFVALGFDSLFITQLAVAFQKNFKVNITFRQLLNELTCVQLLVEYLDSVLPIDMFQQLEPKAVAAGSNSGLDQLKNEEGGQNPGDAAQDRVDVQSLSGHMQEIFGAHVAAGQQLLYDNNTLSVSAGGSSADSIHAVLNAQLQLMAQQLEMLSGKILFTNENRTSERSCRTMDPIEVSIPAPEKNTEKTNPKSAAEGADESREPVKLPPGFGPQIEEKAPLSSLNPQVTHHVEELIAAYTQRTKTSKLLTQQYRSVHADPRTAAGFNKYWKEIVYPIVVKKSKGSRLWDVDDNEYIDLLNGFGPNFFGHAPDYIQEALKQQIDAGFEIGPQTPLAGKVAQLICEITGMERATFVNTGSEAVQAVIRVSRTVTGKDKIVVFEGDYHGNFDEVLVRGLKTKTKNHAIPLAPGIPRESVSNILVLQYGADESIRIIEEQSSTIAAVLIEPIQSRRPEFRPKSFIQKLRKITEEKNIIFIFDEVITGFRTGTGGAQAYYGVKADLVTYGKVIGGGMPIGVVAGKARLMDTFDGGFWQYGDDSFPGAGVTFFAGTFVRHPLAIAAAHASLMCLKENAKVMYQGLYQKTARLATTLNRVFENYGIGIYVAHFSSQMYFRIKDKNEFINLLFYHARMRGIYMLEGFPSYLTLAHTDDDIDRIITVFTESVEALQKAGLIDTPPLQAKCEFGLSRLQADVWMLSQFDDSANCAFNESDSLKLTGSLDVSHFINAVHLVYKRHQAFNLYFNKDGGSQVVDWGMKHNIQWVDLSHLSGDAAKRALSEIYQQEASTPFTLDKGPLVRGILVRINEQEHIFIQYCHHIAFDGWSAGVVFNEIAMVYTAYNKNEQPSLPPITLYQTYVDYTSSLFQTEAYIESLNYWKNKYDRPASVLDLPCDYPRPSFRSFEGASVQKNIDAAIAKAVKVSAREHKVTVFVYLLAAYQVLLYRLSNNEDIVIGIHVAGQIMADCKNLVGHCVNNLPLRVPFDKSMQFASLLEAAKNEVMDAYEHHHVSFGVILENIKFDRDHSRSPLIEAVFNVDIKEEYLFDGLHADLHENPRTSIHSDLFFNVSQAGEDLTIDLDYRADLFEKTTIERWLNHYQVILKEVIAQPCLALENIPLLSPEEREKLLVQWNQN